jgi:hypothetical protein
MQDEKIVKKVIEENKDGLERLAAEEPAEEKRSKLKRLKMKIVFFFKDEKKVGHIST